MSTLYVDTINEKTASNGVQIPGHVVQFVTAATASGTTISTTSTSYIDTGHSVSITPKFSNSKLYVTLLGGRITWSSSDVERSIQVQRDIGGAGYSLIQSMETGNNPSSSAWGWTTANAFEDSPATTSAVTYKTTFKSNSSSGTTYYTSGIPMILTVMEIAQ